MRNPIRPESCIETEREDGNYRTDLQVYMDGMDVFNFAIKNVPKGVKEIAKEAEITVGDIDHLVFHQSNKFMTDFFIKKLKFDAEKVPYCISKYGNTSSASIPLTICSELNQKIKMHDKVVMCGFGAGLSWGTALVSYGDCHIAPVVEY
jgi:3-oxoacyl-[acyl-carrier-protein] synthase-3